MKNYNQTSEDNQDSGVLSNPLSFIRNGLYYGDGGLGPRGSYGYYWSLRSASTTYSDGLGFNNTVLGPQNGGSRGYGFAVRYIHKSFTTLINTSYSMKGKGQTSEDNMDSGLLSNPLSFLRSGNFYWGAARLDVRDIGGRYWSLHSQSAEGPYSLYFQDTGLYPQTSNNNGAGYAVHCMVVLQILHHSH